MTLIMISNYHSIDCQVDTFKDIDMIEFENQTDLNNGMWLHLFSKKNDVFSVAFDPKNDWFDIKK